MTFDPSGGGLLPVPKPASKLPLVKDALVAAARTGMTVDMAARLVGIKPATLRTWLQRGSGEDQEGPGTPEQEELFIAWGKAQAEFLQQQISVISKAAEGIEVVTTEAEHTDGGDAPPVTRTKTTRTTKFDWKAAAFLAERVHPEIMGPKRRPERDEGNRQPPRRVLVLGEIDESCVVLPKVVEAQGSSDETRPTVKIRAHVTDEATGLPMPGGE